jgi:alkanesulfonate monooxygenase SsuD/methylene tetrahydromethanopterin reductase-like flavin-dependent oxidoreductase (luciferase family)
VVGRSPLIARTWDPARCRPGALADTPGERIRYLARRDAGESRYYVRAIAVRFWGHTLENLRYEMVGYAATVRYGLYAAPFGDFAEPDAVVEVATAAERAGWDGFFMWDHVVRPPDRSASSVAIADVWIVMTAVAAATSRLRFGPMITPLARRRPQRVARETVTLDRFSGGRLTLGVGLGVDSGGELSRFGECTDARLRAERLDEALELIFALWSGEMVEHRGAHFRAESVRFLPKPLQQPRIPVWGAAVGTRPRVGPLRRAARLDGLFPVGATADQVAWMLSVVTEHRGSLDGFELAMPVGPDARSAELEALRRVGATWTMVSLPEATPVGEIMELARHSPAKLFSPP